MPTTGTLSEFYGRTTPGRLDIDREIGRVTRLNGDVRTTPALTHVRSNSVATQTHASDGTAGLQVNRATGLSTNGPSHGAI